jgi:hypothetical protein
MFTTLSLVAMSIAKIQERCQVAVGHQGNIAPFAAIASIRSALGHKFLTAEAHTPISTIPGADKNFGFIDKHER